MLIHCYCPLLLLLLLSITVTFAIAYYCYLCYCPLLLFLPLGPPGPRELGLLPFLIPPERIYSFSAPPLKRLSNSIQLNSTQLNLWAR